MGLRDSATNAVRWASLGWIATQGIAFVTNVITARLLAPELFGLITLVLILVSAASMVTCLLLLEWIERRLGWSRALRNATIAIFIFNATVVEYAASLNSEALFTCVTLLGVALLVRARLEPDPRSWLWLAAGLAFGATYFVRYAGLFWLIGLALITFRHVLDRNRRLVTGYGIALLTASVFVLAGVARNIVLVGNWAARPHGHIESQFALGHTLLALLKDTVAALKDLFLGPALVYWQARPWAPGGFRWREGSCSSRSSRPLSHG